MGCGNGENLIERAYAARQSNDNIALQQHYILAVAEVVAWNLYVKVLEGFATLLYQRRHNAYCSSAISLNGITYAIHQTDIATSKHEAMSILSHPFAHFFGHSKEIGVYIVVGRAEYSYFHISSYFIMDYQLLILD